MAIAAGTRFDRYEILSALGAGGMGEVYLAQDTRLGRRVALKLLPARFTQDADRLRRFEQEARAAGMLNHPNILIIHDIGVYDGVPYIVSELLEGEELRQSLNARLLPVRKAIDYALQIARGLAAAHEKGIVHRDLKPENLFITSDGRVKILDFGLAKLTQTNPADEALTSAPTAAGQTDPGVVMGTVGYMSPEQVRGETADHRADLFAFGVILYEMLSGQRAFRGGSAVEMMNAILKEEPPELAEMNHQLAPALERVMRRCLEKKPEQRFQSASDLAFAIEALSGLQSLSPSGRAAATAALPAPRSPLSRWRVALVALVLLIAGLAGGIFIARLPERIAPPSFHQLTFRRGAMHSARFAPDGHTIVYSAAWDGLPSRLFSTRPESPESRSLGLPDADILAISAAGEMAIWLKKREEPDPFGATGTLARVPLAGGAPREILENVQWADWAPDGVNLAIVRSVGGRSRLEFPIEKVLYQTAGFISHPRISPKGDRIAFIDHPLLGDATGTVAVVDLAGQKTMLSSGWAGVLGLAWAPAGDEIWFTASATGSNGSLYAVTLSGRQRVVSRVAGSLMLLDISRDGRVLLSQNNVRTGLMCLTPGETKERDLYWFDGSSGTDLSADGKTLLITEGGEASGKDWAVYLRKTDGSPAIQLAINQGFASALSPDGKSVISIPNSSPGSPAQFMLLPTGPGSPKPLTHDQINHLRARYFPDGKRILFTGHEPGKGVRLYVQELAGGAAQPITPEGVSEIGAISPDGQQVAAVAPDGQLCLYPVAGGTPHLIPGQTTDETPICWSTDGRALYVRRGRDVPAKVYRLDLATGRQELSKELMPADPTGVANIESVLLTPDGKTYAYTYVRILSDLYLLDWAK